MAVVKYTEALQTLVDRGQQALNKTTLAGDSVSQVQNTQSEDTETTSTKYNGMFCIRLRNAETSSSSSGDDDDSDDDSGSSGGKIITITNGWDGEYPELTSTEEEETGSSTSSAPIAGYAKVNGTSYKVEAKTISLSELTEGKTYYFELKYTRNHPAFILEVDGEQTEQPAEEVSCKIVLSESVTSDDRYHSFYTLGRIVCKGETTMQSNIYQIHTSGAAEFLSYFYIDYYEYSTVAYG